MCVCGGEGGGGGGQNRSILPPPVEEKTTRGEELFVALTRLGTKLTELVVEVAGGSFDVCII